MVHVLSYLSSFTFLLPLVFFSDILLSFGCFSECAEILVCASIFGTRGSDYSCGVLRRQALFCFFRFHNQSLATFRGILLSPSSLFLYVLFLTLTSPLLLVLLLFLLLLLFVLSFLSHICVLFVFLYFRFLFTFSRVHTDSLLPFWNVSKH